MLYVRIYAHTHIYIYIHIYYNSSHAHDVPTCERARPDYARAAGVPSPHIYLSIYIYTCTHGNTHIYLWILMSD